MIMTQNEERERRRHFSARRQSPSSPTTPRRGADSLSDLEQPHHAQPHNDPKIRNYRAAGTAPGTFSAGSSPFKDFKPSTMPLPPLTTPSTFPQAPEDCGRVFQYNYPPPMPHYRPDGTRMMYSTKKNMLPVEITTMSMPTTPAGFRPSGAGSPHFQRSVDSVDAKHPCFSDERLHSAMLGVSPQVKSQHQPTTGPHIHNERDAARAIEALQKAQAAGAASGQKNWFSGQTKMYEGGRGGAGRGRSSSMKSRGGSGGPSSRGPSGRRSRSSSRSDSNTKAVLDKKDDEAIELIEKLETAPSAEKKGDTRCGGLTHKKKNQNNSNVIELPRKPTRRDSDCSTLSALSGGPALDESTLTKIFPADEYRGGRAVPSPSPPAALLSEPLSRMDVLSEKIWDYHNKVSQTDEMLQRKLHLRDMLYMAVSPVFPMSGLYVVGSSLNGFGNNSSDMDLCLMITNKELDQKNDAVVVLNLILSTLQYEKFVSSQKLILARVPILRIKFAPPFDDITVDLNANNSVAIRNTHLLCYYSSYDWRVRPLVSVVKEWAKRKGINDANKSSFTSYSLVLMVIHYLQCGTTPKVLPNLQKTYPTRFSNKVDVRTLNVTMPLEAVTDVLEETSPSEKTTLGELLIGFLNYYANQFDYDHDAISIRQGQRVERATLAARPKMQQSGSSDRDTPPPSSSASTSSIHNGVPMHHSVSNPYFWRSQWRCVCIEEPFTNSNTAHSIYDEMVFAAIKEAFREAHTELQDNHDLDRLLECEPIKASTTGAGAAVFSAGYEGERPVSQQPTSIAAASLRAIGGLNPVTNGGHFHFQQQTPSSHHHYNQPPPPPPQQLIKQHRPAGQGVPFQQTNGRGMNHSNQSIRRPYQSQQHGGGGVPRASRGNESFKDTSGQQHQQQQHRPQQYKYNGGGSKENNWATAIAINGGGKHQQQQQQSNARKEEGTISKSKRSSLMASPEPPISAAKSKSLASLLTEKESTSSTLTSASASASSAAVTTSTSASTSSSTTSMVTKPAESVIASSSTSKDSASSSSSIATSSATSTASSSTTSSSYASTAAAQ